LKSKNKNLQISCDGGAATGKSTGAKMISKKYNLKFLSSGLLYRYAGYLLLKRKNIDKIKFLEKEFKKLNYTKLNKINLHTQEISEISAKIAKKNKIRKILKKYQLNFAKKNRNCCIEGRDISTKILPKSDVKFFFICNLNTASIRRFKELKKLSPNITLKDVKKTLKIRNISDIKRKNSPLLKHRDSVVIDTGKLSKQAMLKKMSKYVERVLSQ
jgi:cytidylate kinase|tara:strand:- start:4717 stop:5361 length:645 start_codon:yes stop_codon:yes gene_type:complete